MMAEGVKQWELRPLVTVHALSRDLPPLVVQVLVGRGIDTAEKLRLFLDPPHRLPHNPMRLKGMDLALPRLYRAINQGERVGIFGDFDVDGVTGAALIAEGLRNLGVSILPYLPHRVDEGHGLSGDALRQLVDQGATLIVTVDCGVTSLAEVAQARQLGADVIITDHHTPHAQLPEATAIINPKLPGVDYPCRDLSGAGLAFKLIQGLYQFYGQPWGRSLLELAALGTIADLVPLADENRFLVQQGLAELAQTRRPGLQALYRRAGIQPDSINAETVAFQIAPRLNSPGRMGHARDTFQLLTTSSESEAEALAEKLEMLNQDRRNLTEEAFALASDVVRRYRTLPPILLVGDRSFTPGIAGLVAGRLVETFRRPAVVMCIGDEFAVASGRSIPEFDIIKAFAGCRDLFLRYGGHAQAAGFTLPTGKIPLLEANLIALAQDALGSLGLRPTLPIDAEVKMADLTVDARQWLAALEPFGMANPQPVFLTRRVHVLEARYMGQLGQHLRLRLREGNREWAALAFNQAQRWAAEDGRFSNHPYIDLVYTISTDYWQGTERLTLKALDFRPSSG